ncbi:uncharacterized protein LOC109826570 [Asparagus officinalis]|uniref:uncharacterized protein LOC109826570 n=1 Tax=Asparagus officinalis TaxID=4686 RepID=UPI00098E1D57|nr:uncharacterized protein LOC109826570 [Asparagus officinalis]
MQRWKVAVAFESFSKAHGLTAPLKGNLSLSQIPKIALLSSSLSELTLVAKTSAALPPSLSLAKTSAALLSSSPSSEFSPPPPPLKSLIRSPPLIRAPPPSFVYSSSSSFICRFELLFLLLLLLLLRRCCLLSSTLKACTSILSEQVANRIDWGLHYATNLCGIKNSVLISELRSASFLKTASNNVHRKMWNRLGEEWENEAATLIKYGFQFLLMETNAQLWYIVGEYISSSEDYGVDPTDLISFLLELSFHTMGKWVILDQVQKRRSFEVQK